MPKPKKQADESTLVAALVRARDRESTYIDAAVRCYRQSLEESMSRARAMAMMSGGFSATLSHTTTFDFAPNKESVGLTCTGQIAAVEQSWYTESAR